VRAGAGGRAGAEPVRIAGNGLKLAQLLGLLDEFSLGFEIIEPLGAKR
jgi:alkyl sulfatase BDS1-like metallo-beta-lactamase superfamily hydrolase